MERPGNVRLPDIAALLQVSVSTISQMQVRKMGDDHERSSQSCPDGSGAGGGVSGSTRATS